MTLTQFLSVLRARWWVALAVIAAIVTAAVVGSLLWPAKYTATSSIVVDAKPDPIAAMAYGGGLTPGFIATQMDIINSDRVAFKVVRNLRLNENPQVREQWLAATEGAGTVEQWLGGALRNGLEVTPSKESTVIHVAYSAGDPNFAAALANAFVAAYVETSLELRVDPARQYNTFFDDRTKDARAALEAAQGKLTSFQRERGIIATDERLDVETARLNELSSQLVALQAVTAESRSRQAQARGGSADQLTEVLGNSLVASLRGDLSRHEAQLQELQSRLGDAHPSVRQAQANIEGLRQKVAAETRRVTGGVTVTNTINTAREQQLRAELDAQRAKLLRLKAVRDDGMVLIRDVESAQRTYDALLARVTQTELESQTNRASVNVLSQALAPISPSSPKIVLNTIIAVLLSLFVATAVVLLLELLDRRVRTPQDVVGYLALPVIGTIPKPGAKRRWRGAIESSTMQQRLLGVSPQHKGA